MTGPEPSGAPAASVVMCARDEERYVGEAVHSVLGQTFTRFELVFVDDGSTDRTLEIVRGFDDPRIRVLRNERPAGIARSRNLGIAAAKAPIIVVADADDICRPGRLEEQVAFLDAAPEIGVVGAFVNVIDAEGEKLGVIETPVEDREIKRSMRERAALVHGTLAVRGEALRSVGGYREKFAAGSDYDLICRLAEKYAMAAIPRVLYDYRLTPGSISVCGRGAQRRGIELAKRFARERVDGGVDSYEGVAHREFAPPGGFPSKSPLAEYHLHAGQLAAAAGRMRLARSHFVRSLRGRPLGGRGLVFLLASVLGPSAYRSLLRAFGTTVMVGGRGLREDA